MENDISVALHGEGTCCMSLLDMTLQHAFLYYLSSEEEREEEELPNFQEVAVQTESTAAEMTGKLQNKPVDFGSKLTYWQICI